MDKRTFIIYAWVNMVRVFFSCFGQSEEATFLQNLIDDQDKKDGSQKSVRIWER